MPQVNFVCPKCKGRYVEKKTVGLIEYSWLKEVATSPELRKASGDRCCITHVPKYRESSCVSSVYVCSSCDAEIAKDDDSIVKWLTDNKMLSESDKEKCQLTNEQIVLLAKELLKNQGNCYDVAIKLFGKNRKKIWPHSFPAYCEGTFSSLLEDVGGIFSCMECERWTKVEDGDKHPVYTRAGICICKPCLKKRK